MGFGFGAKGIGLTALGTQSCRFEGLDCGIYYGSILLSYEPAAKDIWGFPVRYDIWGFPVTSYSTDLASPVCPDIHRVLKLAVNTWLRLLGTSTLNRACNTQPTLGTAKTGCRVRGLKV